MNVLYICTAPILAKSPILVLKSRTPSSKLGCALKDDSSSTTMQVPHKKSLESFETPLDKISVYEQSDVEGLPPNRQKQTLLDLDGNQSSEDMWKLPNSESDKRKKYSGAGRRRKSGQANKGRTAWNKGWKHTAETRRLIKERTIEALKDPKVRKKMSEHPHFFSEQSKKRLSISLKKLWAERLKEKKVREEWYLAWAFSVAEAAKVGGYDQNELEWDSYEELKTNIQSEYLQWKEEKERRREIKKLKMLEVAERKAVRMARQEQERREKEGRARAIKMKMAKKLEDKIFMPLTHLKKKSKSELFKKLVVPVPVQEVGTSNETDLKKWDLEFVKKEKARREISLAEQIQAAKLKQVVSHIAEHND